MDIVLSFIVTLVITFIVPIIIYGIFAKLTELKEPEKKLSFFAGVLIQKIGTSAGFVTLYTFNLTQNSERWLIYSLIWVAMFAIVEIGQGITSRSPKAEVVAGIISELIYFPLAAYVMTFLLN